MYGDDPGGQGDQSPRAFSLFKISGNSLKDETTYLV